MVKYLLAVVGFFAILGTQAQNSSSMKTFLALGDSYTIGESVPINKNWPYQLHQRLIKQGINLTSPTIVAKTGWTTDELLEAIQGRGLDDHYDLVTLLIGVNNQYRDYPIKQYQKEFKELLGIALDKAGGLTRQVLVISIPDYGVTPFAAESDGAQIAREIQQYNQIAGDYCKQKNITFVDIYPVSQRAAQDPQLTAEDKLHPSAKMYSLWVDLIYEETLGILK